MTRAAAFVLLSLSAAAASAQVPLLDPGRGPRGGERGAPAVGSAVAPAPAPGGKVGGPGGPAAGTDAPEGPCEAATDAYTGLTPSLKHRKCFFDRNAVLLSSISATFSDAGGSASAEVYRDWFGRAVQLTLAVDIDRPAGSDEESKKESAVQRLVTSGGSVSGTFAFPGPFVGFLKRSYVGTQVYLRLAYDVPAISGTIGDPAGSGELGFAVQARLGGDEKLLGVFLEGRAGALAGTQTWAQGVGRSPAHTWFDVFGLFQVGGGFILAEAIQFGFYVVPGLPADVARATPRIFVRTTLLTR